MYLGYVLPHSVMPHVPGLPYSVMPHVPGLRTTP